MSEISGTVYGQLVSKANSRRLVTIGGRPRNIKSAKALSYEDKTLKQLAIIKRRRTPLKGQLGLECIVYYPSRRQDLDVSLFMDILQKSGIIENDRQFCEMSLRKELDKTEPRVEFAIWQVE